MRKSARVSEKLVSSGPLSWLTAGLQVATRLAVLKYLIALKKLIPFGMNALHPVPRLIIASMIMIFGVEGNKKPKVRQKLSFLIIFDAAAQEKKGKKDPDDDEIDDNSNLPQSPEGEKAPNNPDEDSVSVKSGRSRRSSKSSASGGTAQQGEGSGSAEPSTSQK